MLVPWAGSRHLAVPRPYARSRMQTPESSVPRERVRAGRCSRIRALILRPPAPCKSERSGGYMRRNRQSNAPREAEVNRQAAQCPRDRFGCWRALATNPVGHGARNILNVSLIARTDERLPQYSQSARKLLRQGFGRSRAYREAFSPAATSITGPGRARLSSHCC